MRTCTGVAAASAETVGTVDEDTRTGGQEAAEVAAVVAELGQAGPKTETAAAGRAFRPVSEAVGRKEPVEAAETWDGATRAGAAAEAGAAAPLEAGRLALEEEKRCAGVGGRVHHFRGT